MTILNLFSSNESLFQFCDITKFISCIQWYVTVILIFEPWYNSFYFVMTFARWRDGLSASWSRFSSTSWTAPRWDLPPTTLKSCRRPRSPLFTLSVTSTPTGNLWVHHYSLTFSSFSSSVGRALDLWLKHWTMKIRFRNFKVYMGLFKYILLHRDL